MTLAYRDSSLDRPNAAQAKAAFDAGVRVWGGYLAAVVPPGPRAEGGSNLITSWTQADFQVLQAAGLECVAYASGWDDAAACGALAEAWGVRLMLDCEDGIRGDGPWVDAWLGWSGAGIYGPCSVQYHLAPAHIVARYPGVPVDAATWDPQCAPVPTGLLGWQAEGTHTDPATGLSVDGGWVDDGFAGGTMTQGQREEAVDNWYWTLLGRAPATDADRQSWVDRILPDGSNLRLVRDEFASTDEAQAYAKIIGELRTGTLPVPPVAPHQHTVTVSGTTSAPVPPASS